MTVACFIITVYSRYDWLDMKLCLFPGASQGATLSLYSTTTAILLLHPTTNFQHRRSHGKHLLLLEPPRDKLQANRHAVHSRGIVAIARGLAKGALRLVVRSGRVDSLVGGDAAGERDGGVVDDVVDARVADVGEVAVLDGGVGRCGACVCKIGSLCGLGGTWYSHRMASRPLHDVHCSRYWRCSSVRSMCSCHMACVPSSVAFSYAFISGRQGSPVGLSSAATLLPPSATNMLPCCCQIWHNNL